MQINFKKLIKSSASRLSRERVITYAILTLFIIFLVLLVWDAVIFLQYYRIAVEPARPAAAGRVEISRPKLEKVLEIIKKREAAP